MDQKLHSGSGAGEYPFFSALKTHCAGKPEAVEDHPWGETVFKVRGKVFAFLGTQDRSSVTVKASPDQLDGLLALPFIQRAAYVGRFGWVTVAIEDAGELDLALDLIDISHELISSKARKPATSRP